MKVYSKIFFKDLNVNTRYFIKVFINHGVKSPFCFDYDDLIKISNIPDSRYKSRMVIERAKSLLEVSPCPN